jgi:hypothetical protein
MNTPNPISRRSFIHNSLKSLVSRTLAILCTSLVGTATAMAHPFFACDNGLGKKSPTEQAALLKDLGCEGIGYTRTGDFAARKKAFDEQGLKSRKP